MANNSNLKPFVKGDPRINRKGRAVKGRDAFRKEWEKIWAEILFDSNGNPIIDEVTGEKMTRLRARMKTMTTSRNVKELEMALHYTYGKPREEIDVTSDGKQLSNESEIYDRIMARIQSRVAGNDATETGKRTRQDDTSGT